MKEFKIRYAVLLEMSILLIGSFVILGIFLTKLSEDINLLKDHAFLAALIVFIVVFGIYDFITIFYLKEDVGKKIITNTITKELHIKKRNHDWKISKTDIQKCYIVESRQSWSSSAPFRNHKYAAIFLKSGRLLIITSLIANPQKILNILNWKYELIEHTLPYIDYKIGSGILTEEIFEKKVNEFYKRFSNKSEEELLEICNKPDIYANYAIESARRLLKKMK